MQAIDERLDFIKKYSDEELFLIRGAMMYHTMLPQCSKVYLKKVDEIGGAEVFLPNLDEMDNWTMTEYSEPIDDNGHTIRFTVYENSNPVSI